MKSLLGTHDVVFLTLDTLRFDVASRVHREGRSPNFARVFPQGWEERLTSGSFTYAAHHAFFAGFLPVPRTPGPHPRLFACAFPGSETIGSDTLVFEDAPNIVHGFASHGYRTVCIGGVGFFNPATALGRVLPGFFQEAHFERAFSVVAKDSPEAQFTLAASRIAQLAQGERTFLFINISALHQPNCHYLEGHTVDSLETHAAALEAVDRALPILLDALQGRDVLLIACADHGTAYGEDGLTGHRTPHPVVWTVPYAHAVLKKNDPSHL